MLASKSFTAMLSANPFNGDEKSQRSVLSCEFPLVNKRTCYSISSEWLSGDVHPSVHVCLHTGGQTERSV